MGKRAEAIRIARGNVERHGGELHHRGPFGLGELMPSEMEIAKARASMRRKGRRR